MLTGVSTGFDKTLEAVGVGYRFQVSGNKITVSAGYSHPVIVEVPNGMTVTSDVNTEITIHGIDKQKVTEFAANIRKIREPEPYKGKGIRYKDEHIRRKEGKKAA
jgi:large subunit ribosomal protein L6